MPAERRTFTREFKLQAVKMITDQGLSYAEVARKLGVHESLLRKWKAKLDTNGLDAFPGPVNPSPLEAELEQLRAENKRVLAGVFSTGNSVAAADRERDSTGVRCLAREIKK